MFLPSLASVPMLAFACVCAPLARVQSFWRTLHISGGVKLLVLAVLFALAVKFYGNIGI